MSRPPLRPAVPLLLAVLAAAAPGAARAAESAPAVSPRATVTLAAAVETVVPGQPFRVGLRQRLAPGWHTYWANPGDAGAPPELAFTLPDGAAAGPLEWPAPARIPYGPLVNHGYEGEVLIPATVTPPAGLAPGATFAIEAAATWLVCEKVCVPEEAVFRLDLPVAAAPAPDRTLAPLFAAAEAALPRPWPWEAIAARGDGNSLSLTLRGEALAPAAVREAHFFPAAWGVLDHAAPQALAVEGGRLTLALTAGGGPAPARLEGVVALVDGAGTRSAYAVSAAVGPATAAPPAGGLARVLLLAFAGGLLLNLMPCVFPVLAMKAMALARLSGERARTVRAHAASYTAGVLAAFLALGGLLVALRLGGSAAGWGFQFTSPAFVAVTAWLMLAVGLNLSGVFAVGGAPDAGGALARRGGHLGSAATGALAVVVATPCSAPFMAAAIGAALALPPAAALAVFGAMGLGLAAPYALLGLFPALAARLPRPGAWMERLRRLLAFPMYATAAWLVWVLALQAGPDGVLAALGGAVLVGFGAWALGEAQGAGPRGRRAGTVAALASLAAAGLLLPRLAAAVPQAAAAEAGREPWSPERVAALRAEGRPVFVDLTAAWCITCQVNDRVALRADSVRAAFAARRVALLVGDWTRGDAAIGALLRAHGREGVPLYLLYPADGGPPALLPQVLTAGLVLAALEGG